VGGAGAILRRCQPSRFAAILAFSWITRSSIPPSEQCHVYRGVIREHSPLEDDTALVRHLESVAVRCRLARFGVKFSMHAVERHELPQVFEQ
jgi:hypothetical protein